jgi:hypothetical protein
MLTWQSHPIWQLKMPLHELTGDFTTTRKFVANLCLVTTKVAAKYLFFLVDVENYFKLDPKL